MWRRLRWWQRQLNSYEASKPQLRLHMAPPLLIRSRAGIVEASHSGAFSIRNARGRSLVGFADDLAWLPRSAIKIIHALPFVECGAADQTREGEIALAAASHLGEPEQIAGLAGWIARLGLQPSDIVCGSDFPLMRGGRGAIRPLPPSHLTNNNLGKHLALIATAMHLDETIEGYAAADHPAMQRLFAVTESLCDVALTGSAMVVDNCGLPTVPIPLAALALGMARLAAPRGMPTPRQMAISKLLDSLTRESRLFGGTHALVGQIIRCTNGRIIAKGGSEGIFVALDRHRGLGYALKIDDGSAQAASVCIVELLARAGSLSKDEARLLRAETNYWEHRFAPERSQDVAFPLFAGISEPIVALS